MPPELCPEDDIKVCARCDVIKLHSDFYRDKSRKDGRENYCKPCSAIRKRERYKRTPSMRAAQQRADRIQRDKVLRERGISVARVRRLKTYGLTPEGFDALLEAQAGVCAICGTNDWWRGAVKDHNQPLIDHCHETDTVRGLLCNNCNTMLGHSKDRPEILRAAAQYLEMAVSA